MDSARFEHLMELENSGQVEEVVRASKIMLAETSDDNERASVLINMCVSYAKLGRLKDARHVLQQLKQLKVSHLGIRLNAEFCKPTLLLQEGKYDEGLSAFAMMIERYGEDLKRPEHRYLYEDIQCRRALTLFGLSRYQEALPILREAISFPFNQRADEQQIHFALGACFEDANDIEAAKREFIRVVGFGLKNEFEERALWRLAIADYKAGALALAQQQLETILRDFSSQGAVIERKQVYLALSQTYHYLGDKANENFYAALAKQQ